MKQFLSFVFSIIFSFSLSSVVVHAQDGTPQHGLSIFGDLALPEDFDHFAYVNPEAPKGGALRLRAIGTFDTLNPFTLKGRAPRTDHAPFNLQDMIYASLMVAHADEPDAVYASVARAVAVDPKGLWVRFYLDERATFHDGTPITPEDIAFSINILKSSDADPVYRIPLRPVDRVETDTATNSITVFIDPELPASRRRDFPSVIAILVPVLSKAWFEENPLSEASLKSPNGSGPYRVAEVDGTSRLVLERVADHWAQDIPTWKGRFNYDRIELDYYLDRTAAFEAFGKGEYDVREEFTSRLWATGYTFPAVEEGKIQLLTLPDERISGVQAWFLNTRREKFQDPRVRQALGLAFDFEWTNRTLFYGLYERTRSIFQGSDIAATVPLSDAEEVILDPFRADLPSEVFTTVYEPSVSDGSGRIRQQLRQARQLLEDAGWTVQDNVLKNAAGEAFTLEFLIRSKTFERVIAPFVANLERLGIEATIRLVDSSQYQNRVESFDFDTVVARYAVSSTPGVSLENLWGSVAANQNGSRNLSGLANPAVDALIEQLGDAQTREELEITARALDRAIMWQHVMIPQWSKGTHTLAVWDIFGRPDQKPRYDLGLLDTWWIDPAKAAALADERH